MSAETLQFLDPSSLRFFLPEGGAVLRAEIKGDRCITHARVKRAFPLSDVNGYLSIQDMAGKEFGMIDGLDGLDPESRKVVEKDLDRRYFTPRIVSFVSLKNEGGMWTFKVATQRGEVQFYVRNWRDSAFEIAPGRWLIHSIDGQRFEIQHVAELDTRSQALMEQLF